MIRRSKSRTGVEMGLQRTREYLRTSTKAWFPRDAWIGYLFVLPIIVLLVALLAYPIIMSLRLCLYDKMIGRQESRFVGLANFRYIFGDSAYWRAAKHTLMYTGGALAGKVLLALGIALLLNQSIFGRGFLRGLVLLPWSTPIVAVCLSWSWILSDQYGVLNYLLREAGLIGPPIRWLTDPRMALLSIIIVTTWRGFPFVAINIMAALQSIPQVLYEAAEVDGAGAWQRFMHITIPGIAPVLGIAALLSGVWTFNGFNIVWILTRGGPGRSTDMLAHYTYRTGMLGYELSKAVTVSITMMIPMLIFIFFLTRMLTRREEEL